MWIAYFGFPVKFLANKFASEKQRNEWKAEH